MMHSEQKKNCRSDTYVLCPVTEQEERLKVAELRRFRAYRNMILTHGMTKLYHEPEYNELRDRVLEHLDSFSNDAVRAIAYFYYVNASSIHFISHITNYSVRQILRIRDNIERELEG